MDSGHMSIKRIVLRCFEELNATKKIAKVTSWPEAFNTFLAKLDIQIMNRNGFWESPIAKKHLVRKHNTMIKYFENTFGDFFDNYDYERLLPEDDPSLRNCIWICWWQGLENAPELVKTCIDSIQKNAGKYRVIILTDDNYKDYVTIPSWVEEKRKAGIISRTNYSDLLRLSLLAEHGGMWLDATFFCVKPIIDEYFSYPLWSIKRPDYLHCSIASGYFATYSLQCKSEKRWIFATVRDFFLHYWKTNNTLIDYLIVDYMIVCAQRKDPRIGAEFKDIVPNNSRCDDLYKVLGKPFDEQLWESLKKDTCLMKLTWKQKFPRVKNGRKTFYAKLLDGEL